MKPQRLSESDWGAIIARGTRLEPDVASRVDEIIGEVRRFGDAALHRLTQELDGADLNDPWLSPQEWAESADAVGPSVARAIDSNLARIMAFHEAQVTPDVEHESTPGLRLGRRAVPLQRVACYAPGGRASYPSSVLMTLAPALVAGVQDRILVTPPRPDGSIDPAVSYAARAAGATAILRAGGAQAIAALALGTASIEPVQAIVGPGNAFVTAAKQALQDQVRIDMPAGPSELVILADASARPQWIVWDLLAQAEHDPAAQVILVTTDTDLAEAVAADLAELHAMPRQDIIEASLRDHGLILVARDLDEAVAFCNAYAAEHLAILTEDPHRVLEQIQAAGSVFLGPDTPVSLGDYGSGTNHVLPTMGFARQRGGLSVADFQTHITWQEASREALGAIAPDIITLADAEGLHNHGLAVSRRLEETP